MWRHDKVGQVIHWKLCQKFNIPCKDKWYDHEPEGVIENDQVKVLWDFRIQTDHQIEHNRPDVVVLDKIERSCYVIDIACPFDTRVLEKEQEKMEKYQELKREIGKIWSCRKVIVVPLNCHWCTRDVQQKFENIVEENWTRLHGITTKSLLVGNGKNLEKNTRHLRP